jgi:hypothetical protein
MTEIKQIAEYLIFGEPLVVILGIATLTCLIITACVGSLKIRRIFHLPLNSHYWMAGITIMLGVVHGLLIMLSSAD